MRKKFTMLLAALFLTLGTAWAQTQTAEVQGSTTVEKPEHQYVMKSGNDYWMAANTAPTKHKLGRFAFFEVTETSNDANDYKIYSIDLQKWVSYNKAGSYSNGMEFAKLVDSQENAQPWSVEKKTVGGIGYYQITPYNNNGVAAKYMNWFGGIDASYYSYDDTKTVGLWHSGAGDDAGSRWTLAECSDLGSIADGGDIATTWTPSSWWTTNDAKGSNVLEAVKAVETTQYSTGNSKVMMRYMHMQVPAGRLDVTLSYQTGNNRLDIVGVDLLNANGEVVVSDYHFGYTGNAKSLNTYTLPVETAGSYSLRYWVTFKSQPNNSNGNIAIAHTSVAELKEAAKAELDKLAKLSIVTVGDAKTQVDAVDANANPNAAINAILVDVKKSVDGKNVRFTTYGRNATDGSDITAASNGTFFTTLSGDAGIWTLKSNDDGTFKMYNFLSNLYLGVTAGDGKHLATCSDFAAAGSYTFNPISEDRTNLKNNGNALHADGWGKIVQWNPDHTTAEASIWSVISCEPIAITREQYDDAVAAKAALPNAIQQAYGLVTDASKYSSNAPETDPAEGSSFDNLLDNNYSSYFHSAWSNGVDGNHYLQAEVSEEVKDFCFYFKKRHNTNNNRPTEIEILGSTDGTEFTPIATINSGLPTNENEIEYFSPKITAAENVKYLRFVVKNTNTPDGKDKKGNLYFHFSEFYIFPAMHDVTNLIEAYKEFSTLSITNSEIINAATALINAEKTLALANIKKVVDALLKTNESNHSDTPVLGQYTTIAYNELDAAYKDAEATQESLEAAIAKFEKAKNRPVFFIESMKDYALNQGIYEIDASNLKFKEKNEFDKTMWWSFDITSTKVSCTDRVVVRNVGSGNLFWGAEYVSVIETEPAVEGDGVFMFKTKGTGDPVHAQESGSEIVRWSSADANTVGGASTWKFTYIGNSYDLGEYDDEYAAACDALEAAYIAKRDWLSLFGDGVGQYSGDSESFLAPLTTGTEMLTVKLSVLLENYDTQDIVDATTAITAMQEADILTNQNLTLNPPVAGKYYRIKGANDNAAHYLTGNVTVNGSHIALQADKNNATIFRYVNNKLLAVESNLYVAMTSSFYTFQILEKNAPSITFAASSRKAGAYTINSGRYFHYNSNNTEGTFLDRCSADPADHTAHDWYLEEVAESEVPANTNLLTDINNLSGEASYRIYGDRGFIYVADDGHMKGTNVANVAYNPNNNKHHFAIVTIGGNKYLYNVGTKKFVMKSGNGVTLTDWPEQAITIEGKTIAGSNVGYDWVIKLGDNRLNLSTGSGHTYGVFTNYNTEDAGNVWAIYKVGSFAPAEAQSMKKVIVNYTIDGVAATETVGVAANSTLNFSYEFATVTSCKVGEEAQTVTDGACSVTIQDNVTISVAMTSDNRLFRLKNTASSKYMTIVAPEAAEGVQIKDKADDPVKQAFRIVLANWQGKYNIKSTENYFMASSTGGWDYGAYQTTTNEAGRVHELEALDEGKYGLKTLNGYAGPNSGVTADGSPLYSNHGAGNSGRKWELEELTKSSITYIYKWNDQTIESEVHENVYEGLAAPATAVTLPFGFSYDNAALPTTKGAGNEEVVITCTLSLPFQYAATYQAIEENGYWYYLKFDSGNNYYLHHAAGQDHIALDSKAVDKKNKDVYSWGFVGDPVNGYKIVNKAAGNTMILSSSTTMEGETGAGTWPIMTVEEGLPTGNNTLWIPTDASTHATNGFFLAQKGFPNNRLNNRGKLAYWTGGAGTGSTFVVEARPFGPVAELEELLIEAEELKAVVDANKSDKIGDYSEATATALAAAITEAKNVTEPTAADVTALENVVLGTKINLPTPGAFYQIHSTLNFAETKAVYSDGSGAMWKSLNEYDKSFYWRAVETNDGGIAFQNVKDEKFLNGNAGQSGSWTVSDVADAIGVKVLSRDVDGKGYRYGIILKDWQMHANGHGEGKGEASNIVSWNGNENSASSWYIIKVDLPTFYTVTYNFKFEGDTKYTQTTELAPGAGYPDMDVFLPYGVSSNFTKPEGTVSETKEYDYALTVDKVFPLKAADEVNNISSWYYVQMHANPTVTAYIEDANGVNVAWNNKSVEDEADIDSHLWGFVGDIWKGLKVVNKATKRAIVSTSGNAILGDAANATAFIPAVSNGNINNGWFCLKYPESNYLNAQGDQSKGEGKVGSYDKADNGSSFFITEDTEYTVSINEKAGFGTYYSDYKLTIPNTVTAYVVSGTESNYANLEEVTGVIPAKTAIILEGGGEHKFKTSAAAPIEISSNLLRGTSTKTLIQAETNFTYYVLAMPEGATSAGLYKAKVNKDKDGKDGTTHFYNNANKVYLPVETPGQAAPALVMRFGRGQGTTEIELPTANGQQPTAVYDLQGRRVLNPTKGMYIVNGKKVVIR